MIRKLAEAAQVRLALDEYVISAVATCDPAFWNCQLHPVRLDLHSDHSSLSVISAMSCPLLMALSLYIPKCSLVCLVDGVSDRYGEVLSVAAKAKQE